MHLHLLDESAAVILEVTLGLQLVLQVLQRLLQKLPFCERFLLSSLVVPQLFLLEAQLKGEECVWRSLGQWEWQGIELRADSSGNDTEHMPAYSLHSMCMPRSRKPEDRVHRPTPKQRGANPTSL